MTANFLFLQERFPALAALGGLAEQYCFSDPNSCLIKLGMLGETIVNLMFSFDNISLPPDNTAVNRINTLFREGLLTEDLCHILHSLRKYRNKAAHENYDSRQKSADLLEMAYHLCEWFMQTYGDWNYQNCPYAPPAPDEAAAQTAPVPEMSAEEEARTEQLIAEAVEAAGTAPAFSLEARKQRAVESASQRVRSEAETRSLIDDCLCRTGWEADSAVLRYAAGARPDRGHNRAIAEWPVHCADGSTEYADYALFLGTELAAIIEAKSAYQDIPAAIDGQCREYARHIRQEDGNESPPLWGAYHVPFVFAANGRPYLEQVRTKSGIWFLDLRRPDSLPKPLRGWFSPTGLRELLKRDTEAGNQFLRAMPETVLRDPDGLSLFPFQIRAVRAVEKAILEGREMLLLAMATGTGKTRTALALLYRLLASERFRRVLFLVDRNALGEQAEDKFAEVRIQDLKTLPQIYTVRGIKTGLPRQNPKPKTVREYLDDAGPVVQIATVQSMVRRLFESGDGVPLPGITDYDLIIVDEAHRGYILDRELGEEELLYRDQRDYQSQYRRVIDYFDAVKIGLTATPALHTTQIFGAPVFWYTYTEAVTENYLIDHDAPHNLKTKLYEEGIHYQSGDDVTCYDPVTGTIQHSELLADELDFDADDFNRRVIDENFDRTVLTEIAGYLHPEAPEIFGKTLIFAVNDAHADRIVDILREIYRERHLDSLSIRKITAAAGGGSRERTLQIVREFKNERLPSIAVTVDLLSTGVDVPEITTLVFMRCVKSRILFEQMMGRATRPCDKIQKDHFEIFDPVGVYETLAPVSSMRPVAVNPSADFHILSDALAVAEGEERIQAQIQQILARLQRRARRAEPETLERFTAETGGENPQTFAAAVKSLPTGQAREKLLAAENALALLDQPVWNPPPIVISTEPDELRSHTRTYGEGVSPEDYLASFAEYLRENRNEIAALNILCTRPGELTRESLKQLRLALRDFHFSDVQLNSAVSQMTNQEMAADIISLIRRYAIGSTLVSHEERIHGAVEKLKAAHEFTKAELGWIDRMEQYLMQENVLTVSVFDEDGRFRAAGGFARIDKVFRGQLAEIVEELNVYLFDDGGISA